MEVRLSHRLSSSRWKRQHLYRSISLQVSRLVLLDAAAAAGEYYIAARVRKTPLRHTLRCPQPIPIDTHIDLEFNIEYAHRHRGDTNILQIILQRKRTKTAQLKTCAYLHISMDEVLQMPLKSVAVMYMPRFKRKDPIAQIHIHVNSKYGIAKHKHLGNNMQDNEELYDQQREDYEDMYDTHSFLLLVD
jgi:hypothetical protein